MDDLISRQAAIDAIGNDIMGGLNYRHILLGLQSAQRKTGKWMRITDEVFADRFECSECGKLPPIENFEWWLSDYCPNCGASMKGEQDVE